ncbi:RNA:NAD 2'-phosphotransferase [Nostoc flagelliforme CCNUN1]|uniref:RNA:NAD 2'-phosphotransferase n=1 Tax=Nostoc flagelliforme CCNUN1 TaxID=2038116 RepID=A0A2K8SIS9_9NOSO|nr:RNA:NAD 2'-phosphotransferase [Nostoc flagelliforme CCNUN1]
MTKLPAIVLTPTIRDSLFLYYHTSRANASKLYLLTTEVKNQRKISISRLIYFHRFKAIA